RGAVAGLDWDGIRSLDAGSWFATDFAGCRVPTLDETIDLAVEAGIPLCIEIKGTTLEASATAEAVASLLRNRDLVDRMFVSSFDHGALAAVARRIGGGALLAPERLPEAGPADPATAVAQASALRAT